jgi:lipid-A-disaccharide synthase-like uncharacterized protein
MNEPIAVIFNVVVTPWKLVGYLGVLLFAGRWVVQVLATRRHGRPAFPGLFWTMSLAGSALLLSYFIWGKNDSVGVMSNLFPMAVAGYNFVMHQRHKRSGGSPPGPSSSSGSSDDESQDESLTMMRA